MVSQDPAIRPSELGCTAAVVRQSAVGRMRAVLMAAIVAAFALTLSTTAHAATITIDSLADSGASGICVLRDAITASNTMTATNGCIAGTGNDTIRFSVTGTSMLGSSLPKVTDSLLTINGPASPGITIDGGGTVQVMTVASPTELNLKALTIVNGGGYGPGAGILNHGTLSITNSTFSGNGSYDRTYHGGAIANLGTLTATNSTISDNNTYGSRRLTSGGGIYNDGGTLTVTNSNLSGNITSGSGGGIENVSGTLTVTNSTISGNRTYFGGGGGIYNFAGTLTMTNSTFSGNFNDSFGGGGINNFTGTLTVTNSTFSGNFSKLHGSAIFGGTLKSTIVADTYARDIGLGIPDNVKSANCSGVIDGGYNISDDQSCGFSAIGSLNGTNPQLDPAGLSNNGGPTQTIALRAESPAIDAIPVADCSDQAGNQLTTDQRGFPRPDAGEDVCDIGAYEFQDAP